MAEVTFTEQMGAIALIDSMRHRAMRVGENIDLPARAEEAKRRIRSYYDQQRIAVDEKLVEAGVKQYFDRRLTFEPNRLGRWEKLLASAYIARRVWIPKLAIAAGLAASLATATAAATFYWHRYQLESAVASVRAAHASAAKLLDDIASVNAHAREVKSAPGMLALEPVRRLLGAAEGSLQAAEKAVGKIVLPAAGKPIDIIEADKATGAASQGLADANGELQKARDALALAKQLAGEHGRLQQLLDIGGTAATASPVVKSRADQALVVFRQADTLGLVPLQKAVNDLKTSIDAWAAIAKDSGALETFKSRFATLKLTPADLTIVQAYFDAATAAANKLDAAASATALEDLAQLAAFAEKALELSVVDRRGVKSGVERSYDPSKGKSWYLVIEAKDSAGDVVPMPVTSIETGQKAFAKVFALRVSQETYNAVKQDKLADGHVDDKAVGNKPAGTLRPVFTERAFGTTPEYILEW